MRLSPLAVVGVDFRRAPTRARAAMALDEAGRRAMHRALGSLGGAGFAEVSTCNRTEWIAVGDDPGWVAELLRAQAIERLGGGDPYVHTGDEAARHVLRVAMGLESLARGERHIAGQVHDAFARAREEDTACGVLNVVATVVGRAVRRTARLRAPSVSTGMHGLVAQALTRQELPEGPVLVVGMGAIGRHVAERVARDRPVIRVNRTPRAGWRPLDEVLRAPPPHVAVVLCTSAERPVWTAAQIGADTRVVVDIGSPAQADPGLRDAVPVLDLDALVAGRLDADDALVLDEAIDAGLDDLHRALGVRALKDIVRTSREEYRHLSRQALPEALDLVALPPGDRQRLEASLRELLRDHAERMLRAVEQLARVDQ